MNRALLFGGIAALALLGIFGLGHPIMRRLHGDAIDSKMFLALVNAEHDAQGQSAATACLRPPYGQSFFKATMPATVLGDPRGSWLLVSPVPGYGMNTKGYFFGTLHRGQAAPLPFLAAMLDAGVIHRVPARWLRFIMGATEQVRSPDGSPLTRVLVPDRLDQMQGDILIGTPPPDFVYLTAAMELAPGHFPDVITGPDPHDANGRTPPGIHYMDGLCWRLHADRVLEVSDVNHLSTGTRWIVAAIRRRPEIVPAWLTDPRVAGAGYAGQVLTTDVVLRSFHDYGAGWVLDPAPYLNDLANLQMHGVAP